MQQFEIKIPTSCRSSSHGEHRGIRSIHDEHTRTRGEPDRTRSDGRSRHQPQPRAWLQRQQRQLRKGRERQRPVNIMRVRTGDW